MSSAPGIRGWRNLGWPACYIVGLVMLWSIGWRRAGATWLSVGLATGLAYFLYQAWSLSRDPEPTIRVEWSTILQGAFLWPVMLPEFLEYWLAEIGILKAALVAPEAKQDGTSGGV